MTTPDPSARLVQLRAMSASGKITAGERIELGYMETTFQREAERREPVAVEPSPMEAALRKLADAGKIFGPDRMLLGMFEQDRTKIEAEGGGDAA